MMEVDQKLTGQTLIRNTKKDGGAKSRVYKQTFSVPFEYEVHFTQSIFDAANQTFLNSIVRRERDKLHRMIVFVDQGVVEHFPQLIEQIEAYVAAHSCSLTLVCKPITIVGGEQIKVDLSSIERMQKAVFDFHIDRHSYVIGIGGGAVLDAVGWVAATAHRGVRHIRVPTTVLAQNDSGVGVKNGVNLYGVKNYQGAFAPPWSVINDIDFILGLPKRDQIAGVAEAVKVALIRDGLFFDWLEQNADALLQCDRAAMEYMIQRCAELHMQQIAQGGDPFEMGSARPLDYGHWAAHKLESMTDYQLRHGEAVAIGLALDAKYSALVGLLDESEATRVVRLLQRLGFELWHPMLDQCDKSGSRVVLKGLADFQEHLGGELTITLLDEIGTGVEVHEIDCEKVDLAMEWLQDNHRTCS